MRVIVPLENITPFAQYKKLLHCAYETARTSMDNLVELGFYRKEKLNNKFIYTPVSRR